MIDLTPRQDYWLKRVADGGGAAEASSNVTLRGLARRGLIRVTWREKPNFKGKFAFWVLTDKGDAAISVLKQVEGTI